MIDPQLMSSCAEELAALFSDPVYGVTKVLTVETSGVAPALLTGKRKITPPEGIIIKSDH